MRFFVVIAALFCVLFGPLRGGFPKHGAADRDIRNTLDTYGEILAKQYGLTPLLSGLGSIVGSREGLWALHYTSQEKYTLEQARPQAIAIANALICYMYENPIFASFVKEKKRGLSLDDMGYKIAFWDENVDRPLYPYLAELRLRNGQLYYYYADPKTQKLQEPIIEPLGDQ